MIGKVVAWSVAAVVLFVFVIATGIFRSTDTPTSPAISATTAGSTKQVSKVIDPHEQRLRELRSKRESIAISLQIEMEMGRKLASNAENLSHQPIRDPGERQWLMDKMERQQKLIDDLGHQLQEIDAQITQEKGAQSPDSPSQRSLFTELRGSLASRREYDLRLIRNVSKLLSQSRDAKILSYCMFTAHEAETLSDSAPETEYKLQSDGTVLTTSGKPPKTPEQRFRDGERMQLELETGGGPIVQDCAGSLYWFATWHNKPMPTDEKFAEIAAKAKTDLEEIDKTLDSRLVEILPKP